MAMAMAEPLLCANCGAPAGGPPGPPDGWRLDDGSIVCLDCCTTDLRATVRARQLSRTLRSHHPDANP